MQYGRTAQLAVVAATIALGTTPARAERASQSITERLIDYYASAKNYRRVKRDVLRWHKTTRNGCVAFVSTALRNIGVDIPLREKRDGYGISRITFAFSGYLEERGWQRLDAAEQLRPGDVVFTTGYPDHVFVFHSWRERDEQSAKIIDNQGHLIDRAMFPLRGSDDAAFAYALRAPDAARVESD
jgi:hypothetical protein